MFFTVGLSSVLAMTSIALSIRVTVSAASASAAAWPGTLAAAGAPGAACAGSATAVALSRSSSWSAWRWSIRPTAALPICDWSASICCGLCGGPSTRSGGAAAGAGAWRSGSSALASRSCRAITPGPPAAGCR